MRNMRKAGTVLVLGFAPWLVSVPKSLGEARTLHERKGAHDPSHRRVPAFHIRILRVWEEVWQGRAAQERKAERYQSWLCSQGASRDNAAERVIRVLAEGNQHRSFPPPSAASKLPDLPERERNSL